MRGTVRVAWVVWFVAFGGAAAAAADPPKRRNVKAVLDPEAARQHTRSVGAQLIAGVAARSSAAVLKVLDAPLSYTVGNWRDAACDKKFGFAGTVPRVRLSAFAACLTKTQLGGAHVLAEDEDHDEASIGQSVRLSTARSKRKLITELHYDSMVIQPVKIEKSEPMPITSDPDGVEGGEDGSGEPPPTPPPPPPAPPQNVPPTLLEGSRTKGNKDIPPDAASLAEMQKIGKDKYIASFKLCLTATGAVDLVKRLKVSGIDSWDAKLEREMKQWAYRPYQVNGKPVPVCTAVTFIHSRP